MERRIARRLPIEARAVLQTGNPPVRIECHTTNISATGLFVAIERMVPTQTAVAFEVEREDGSCLIRGRGEVVWARLLQLDPDRPVGVAIRFDALDATFRERLAAVLGEVEILPSDNGRRQTTTRRVLADLGIDDELGADRAGSAAPSARAAAARSARSAPRRGSRGIVAGLLLVTLCVALLLLVWKVPEIRRSVLGPGRVADEPDVLSKSVGTPERAASEPSHSPIARELPGDAGGAGAALPAGGPASRQDTARGQEAPVSKAAEITRITVSSVRDESVITLEADGSLEPDAVRSFRMEDPPRHVLRIRGITRAYRSSRVPSGSPLVRRVRVGLHQEVSPPELAVVLDLADSSVVLVDLKVEPQSIVIRLADLAQGRRQGSSSRQGAQERAQ